jgi:shikimate kinase
VNVILAGLRGTGKSSIGRILAEWLQFTFIDTDMAVESLARSRIADIVAQCGWEYFRGLERQAVASIATKNCHVIASGGGTLMDEDNARLLKKHGVVVLLVSDLAVLQRRIAIGSHRPSLTGRHPAPMELAEVWEVRRSRYEAVADLTYDVSQESANVTQDLQRKATAIYSLLQHFPGFVCKT